LRRGAFDLAFAFDPVVLKRSERLRAMRESLFFTPRVLRSALRAGFAVRAAPAAQWTAKKVTKTKPL
jgi:hypothetical protein